MLFWGQGQWLWQVQDTTTVTITFSITQLITWLVVGLVAGALAAAIISGRRRGFGLAGNLIVGLVGAAVGGYLFALFGIVLTTQVLAIPLNDIIVSFVGALLFLAVLAAIRR